MISILRYSFFLQGGEAEMMKPGKLEIAQGIGGIAGNAGSLLSGIGTIAKLFGWEDKDEKKLAKLQNKLMEQQYQNEEDRKERQRNIRNNLLRGTF